MLIQTQFMEDLRYEIRKFFRRPSTPKVAIQKSKSTVSLERQVSDDEETSTYVPTYKSNSFAPSTFTKVLRSPRTNNQKPSHYIPPSFMTEPSFVKNQRLAFSQSKSEQKSTKYAPAAEVNTAANQYWSKISPASKLRLIEEATIPTVLHATVKETEKSSGTAGTSDSGSSAAAAPAKPGGLSLGGGKMNFSLPSKPKNDDSSSTGNTLGGGLGAMPKIQLKLGKK
ncbi:hypothetical protein TVAG_153480 [Trichomonas vaginalis G3]|uniref:Uncharacterized protein n=1 Tax=Trichomonas vaginalis (strain ATCC PRA-98 / G3) TaxID=412133 RepID=A2G1T5_TRIV3|nr:hypothetical protein TVAGG3_0690610 [Trichomonas vaginalis G3]EAX88886.1 hypothetical protein TVAG_153480 [Trichomonas vaginalis G3]KAI5508538.1 hypothetical protein TVAGG3_0690610 [Trichomonas vaginalis G3]|eukprot:XP_001301816.1 hypothetical protein [Trichomonas vaginalis G3]